MRLTYYVDKPKEDHSVLMLNVALAGRRFRLGTGIALNPKHWNQDKQDVRSADPDLNIHRKRIAAITAYVREAYAEIGPSRKDKLLSAEDVESFVRSIKLYISNDTPASSVVENSLPSRFREFITTYTIRTRTGQITSLRPGQPTLLLYARTLRFLEEWSIAHKKPLTFEMIDESFYTSFCHWLTQTKSMVDTTVSNIIKVVKTFMRWSRQKGYHSTVAWEHFWRDRRSGDTIALSVDELRRMRDLNLADNPRLLRVRDIFLLQAYTGMRYGDLLKLEPKHFDDEIGIIRYTTEKNDTGCVVPVTRPLQELLERYPSRLFEFPSQVKVNAYLKELGRLISMDKQMLIHSFVGGKRIESAVARHELLTSHVARRTYVTTSLRFGVPEAAIARVTGHAAKGILQQHFIIFDEETIRDMICKAWEQL